MSDILFQNVRTTFNKAMMETEVPDCSKFVTTVPSKAKEEVYKWMKGLPGMREWVGDRIIHSLSHQEYTVKNKDYEFSLGLDTNDIEDDQYGMYVITLNSGGAACAQWKPKLCFNALASGFTSICHDGQYFFDTDHPNFDEDDTTFSNFQGGTGTAWFLTDTSRFLKAILFQDRKKPKFERLSTPESERRNRKMEVGAHGRGAAAYSLPQLCFASKQPLDTNNFEDAVQTMAGYKNCMGDPMGINPDLLIVPKTLMGAARRIVKRDTLANGEGNIWEGAAELLETSLL